jgi:hypothetical protein
MTAPTTAASNGHAKTSPAPQRARGMTYVKQAQAYHLANVAHDAAFEGECLSSEIYRAASAGYLRDPGTEASDVAADPAMTAKAEEAVACLVTAIVHLADLFGLPDA